MPETTIARPERHETMRDGTLIRIAARTALTVGLGAIAALMLGASSGMAAGDAAAGQQVFATNCSACHSVQPGVNKVGPSLAGVVGSKSGSVAGYDFSPALKAANITWDESTLDKYLESPTSDIHGVKMFISVPNVANRQNVIAYLETLKP